MDRIYDVCILGGGPGGYTAALYCARAGFSTLVIEKLSAGGQMADAGMIDNYPGYPDGVDGFELGELMQKGAERFGAETLYDEATALSLGGETKEITTYGGKILARTVVLATGANPRLLGVPGEQEYRGRGVSYCGTCDGQMYAGKTVAVVGGGNTAAGDALLLSRICKKVYLVVRRDVLRAAHSYAASLEAAENVEFLWKSNLREIHGDKTVTGVTVVTAEEGGEVLRELPLDGVFIAVGRVPSSELFREQAACDEAGYLIAGEDCRTNLPGVYAVGDVRAKVVRQIVTATADGANVCDSIQEYLAGLG